MWLKACQNQILAGFLFGASENHAELIGGDRGKDICHDDNLYDFCPKVFPRASECWSEA